MKNVKRLWMPLLLGVLLMATLVGVAGARPNARPEASPQLRDHMISAHHCIAESTGDGYEFDREMLYCASGQCYLVCPIRPEQGLIRVQRLAMYAYDNGTDDLCICLAQLYPKAGTYVDRLTVQCTTDNAADPQVYAYNPANFKVSDKQDLYVWVRFRGNTQKLYGFKLKYEPL